MHAVRAAEYELEQHTQRPLHAQHSIGTLRPPHQVRRGTHSPSSRDTHKRPFQVGLPQIG